MTVTSESDLMMFISQKYHERKNQLKNFGRKIKTNLLFEEVVAYAYSLYGVSLEFENVSQIKKAFNQWKSARKKGVSIHSPKKEVYASNPSLKQDILVDPLLEEIEKYNLHPETYF